MNRRNLINKILVSAWAMLAMTLVYAGTPLWTFKPLTATTVNIPENGTTTVKYQVTNQSRKSHTLVITAIPGITQVTTAGNCPSPFSLVYQQSCILTLSVNGSFLSGNVIGGPVVCQQGDALQCYQPSLVNSLNITKSEISNHTVGGSVTGLTGTVTLLNNGTNSTPMSTDGTFTFSTAIAEGSPYAVTVGTQPADQTCTVANGSGIMGGTNVTNVTVTCSTNTYTVGGSVTGLTGTVTLLNNGTNSTPMSTDGTFTFSTAIAEGSTYAVTVGTQPANQTCTVANGSGIMGGTNVTNVSVTCSTNTYTVGGSVTGLTGTVTLLNNATNSTPINTDGTFTFSTAIAEGSSYAVTVGTQPANQTCTVANGSGTMGGTNVTNVSVTCSTNNTTLSVSPTGTIPVDGSAPCTPAPAQLTVTNTGTATAFNVSASLPGGWVGVTQNATCNDCASGATSCTSIAPGDTCILSFTSTTPYVAQGNISITGDNISTPPTTALAFTMDCYLVWAISGSTAQVIATSDATGSPMKWGLNNSSISGITEESTTADGDACNGATDGNCNTGQIVDRFGTPYADYAAGLCYGITSDNSGTVSAGTWYLPAICQMGGVGGYAGKDARCSPGAANIGNNLVKLGFGGLVGGFPGLEGYYFSSTESFDVPGNYAWVEYFVPGGGSVHGYGTKLGPLGVRCSRALTL